MFDRLLDLVIHFIGLGRFWVILEPYQGGVLTRFGKFVRVLDPGLNWIIPLGIDHYITEHTVPRTHELTDQTVTTKDGRTIGFSAVITYQVKDIQKCLLEVEDADHAIRDSCAGTIGQELSKFEWSDIIDGEKVTDSITTACRRRGRRYGLEVTAVQFSTLTLVKAIRLLNH